MIYDIFSPINICIPWAMFPIPFPHWARLPFPIWLFPLYIGSSYKYHKLPPSDSWVYGLRVTEDYSFVRFHCTQHGSRKIPVGTPTLNNLPCTQVQESTLHYPKPTLHFNSYLQFESTSIPILINSNLHQFQSSSISILFKPNLQPSTDKKLWVRVWTVSEKKKQSY